MYATIRRTLVASLFGGVLVLAGGCAGGDFGTDVDLPVSQRHKLTATMKPGTVIKLPKPLPFNVHDKRWNSTPGADGKADPSAGATADGTAFCKADGSNGGSSTAEFQIGHCLDNDSGTTISAELRMTIDYEHACRAEGEGAKVVANYAIKVFVKDTAGRVLQTLPLAAHTTDEGRVSWAGSEKTITEVTMQPGLGYYVVLAGQAQAGSEPKTSTSAHIKVKSFALDIVCNRADKVAAGSTAPSAKKK